MLDLFPEGFEERADADRITLVAYTDTAGEARVREAFGVVVAEDVEADWQERWRMFHHGVSVGPLWVGPPWEHAPAGMLAVTIDPGRAFGTGAHATTRLCLELMARLAHGSLLDVGCGSGVIAIAAARLGFAPVHAVDVDGDAIRATHANAAANGVRVTARELDALTGELPLADVTFANITLADVRALARRIRSRQLVTSGYLSAEEPGLDGWECTRSRQLDGWAAHVWARMEE